MTQEQLDCLVVNMADAIVEKIDEKLDDRFNKLKSNILSVFSVFVLTIGVFSSEPIKRDITNIKHQHTFNRLELSTFCDVQVLENCVDFATTKKTIYYTQNLSKSI